MVPRLAATALYNCFVIKKAITVTYLNVHSRLEVKYCLNLEQFITTENWFLFIPHLLMHLKWLASSSIYSQSYKLICKPPFVFPLLKVSSVNFPLLCNSYIDSFLFQLYKEANKSLEAVGSSSAEEVDIKKSVTKHSWSLGLRLRAVGERPHDPINCAEGIWERTIKSFQCSKAQDAKNLNKADFLCNCNSILILKLRVIMLKPQMDMK